MMRDWLLQKRLDLKLTQEEVADKAGIARTTYASIEQGFRNPSVNVSKRISQVLLFEWIIFFEEKCHESCKNNSA
ncbi:helix-turn-helix transcriptional regulator [Halalkalibacter sp. APA_J-10(15)]|uniref:helix-turn-helix transcriptional regulator n=1 Tax=Halalkalibacter sp. APA_J-10(15) TaxID=2933805 RepID=UPI001FF25D75|nr:helix-turn-helix transcriptional regulator [Halalkalibacter sp. APA_J-10(15)]MCK0470388.1 helix-turn-helix transcriptional regulator [Halalkalibacter sp. APA_J-10(15)]